MVKNVRNPYESLNAHLKKQKGASNGLQVLAHLIEDLKVCLRDSAATAVVHVTFVRTWDKSFKTDF